MCSSICPGKTSLCWNLTVELVEILLKCNKTLSIKLWKGIFREEILCEVPNSFDVSRIMRERVEGQSLF